MGDEVSGDDRGELERRLKHLGNALIVGTVTSYGERDEARRLLFEVADTIGAARRAMEEIDSALASYEAKLSESGCESWIDVDRIRMLIRATVARLEGGG